jgi:hypothetical protein
MDQVPAIGTFGQYSLSGEADPNPLVEFNLG